MLNENDHNERGFAQFDDKYFSDPTPRGENEKTADFDIMQRLLLLTEEAERLTITAAETASRANILAQDLITAMLENNISPPRRQISGITLDSPKPSYHLESPGFGSLEQAVPAVEIATASKALEKKGSSWWQYIRVMAITIVVVVCLRLFIFDVVQVSGGSMIPTLHNTDSLISSKIAYKLHEPQRYDIVLLDAPDQSGYFIKRIIGLPNEHIEIKDGLVFINEVVLPETYLVNIYTDGDIDTIIPDGFYFVMGDNRPISRDSRADSISNIAKEHIKGKAIFRFYPLSSFRIL